MTVAVAFTIRHADSSRRDRAAKARNAFIRTTNQQQPLLPRATMSLVRNRQMTNINVEAEVKTGAGSEARLQAKPGFVELAPGKPETTLLEHARHPARA